MILHFPSFDVLRLAITSGTVPEAMAAAPVRAGFGPEGDVWLEPAAKPPRALRTALERLGIDASRTARHVRGPAEDQKRRVDQAAFPLVNDGCFLGSLRPRCGNSNPVEGPIGDDLGTGEEVEMRDPRTEEVEDPRFPVIRQVTFSKELNQARAVRH